MKYVGGIEGKFFIIVECQLVNAGGIMKLENSLFCSHNSSNWFMDESTMEHLKRNRIVTFSEYLPKHYLQEK